MKKQPILKIPNSIDIKTLLSNPNDRDRGIMLFLLNTGLRVSELVNLNYKDIYYNGHIRNAITIIGKGNKERYIPLNNPAKEGIKLIDKHNKDIINNIDSNTPFILNSHKDRMSRNYLSTMIHEYADKCGIDMTISAHTLRHTFVTMLLQNGVNIKDIQTLVGHSDIKTTMNIYCKSTTNSLTNAVNTLKY
jgi:site-specific recombinase XerD